MRLARLTLPVIMLFSFSAPLFADMAEYRLVIRNHQFSPATLEVPAGQKIRLVIENQDPTPEEFESHKLNREKIVPANGKATIFLGPLDPGQYPFFGEFNAKTATGTIIVK